jgi:apolipoprotein N-acyltransferase
LPLPFAQPLITLINHFAKQHDITLLLGLPVEISNKPPQNYTSLLALGTAQGIYHKKLLVPFGEYLPFAPWLRGLINFFAIPMSDFIAGPKFQAPLVIPKSKLLPLICYEIAYPEQVRQALLEQQSDAIVTISEDGWFGDSWGPKQHLAIARMRALENGRFVLRSTTSGISAIINEKGQVLQQAPQFKPYVLTGEFRNFSGNTPWTKYGQWPIMLFCSLLLILPLSKKLWCVNNTK